MAALFLLVGCTKEVNVKLSESTHNFEAAGGSAEIALESDGAWQVGTCPEWITVSPSSGEGNATLTLTCEGNVTGQERSAEIMVSTKTNEAVLAVKQTFVEGDFITFTPDSLNCDFQGGEFSIKVNANCDWSIAPLPNWIQCEPMSGNQTTNVIMTIQRYSFSSEGNREFNVDFVAGEQHFYFPVKQDNDQAYHVLPTPGDLVFSSEGGTQTVALQSITAWTLECTEEWVSVTPTSGDGNGEISVTVAPNASFNPRSARVVLTSSVGCISNVRISQEASINPHFLDVNPSELVFPAEESSLELSISTDSTWRVKYSEPWISVSQENGVGNATITVTAQANNLLGNRHAEVDVISGTLQQTIPVTQASGSTQPILSFTTDHLQLDCEHSFASVSVSSNVQWTLRMSEDWILPNVMEGLGDADIQIEVKDNFEQEPRTAMLYLCYHDVVYDTLFVEQEARVYHIEANATEFNASNQGDTFVVSVSANQSWHVYSIVTWVHFEPKEGYGDGTFRIIVDPNNSVHSRTAEIRLAGDVDGLVTIFVNQ